MHVAVMVLLVRLVVVELLPHGVAAPVGFQGSYALLEGWLPVCPTGLCGYCFESVV